MTSIAKDVSNREAERICNSVNGMLKTLNGQLMLSVDEVNYENNEATLMSLSGNRMYPLAGPFGKIR